MKKKEFPMVVKVKTDSGLEFNVRPFLTYADLMTIVNQAKESDNVIDRRFIADLLVARFCTDITELDKDDVEYNTLDLYRANGVFDLIYENIRKSDVELLNKSLDELDTASAQLKGIRSDFIAVCEALKDYASKIDLNAIQNGLKEDLNKLATLDGFNEVKKLIE